MMAPTIKHEDLLDMPYQNPISSTPPNIPPIASTWPMGSSHLTSNVPTQAEQEEFHSLADESEIANLVSSTILSFSPLTDPSAVFQISARAVCRAQLWI
jgi:hypothetical protein